MAEMISKKVLWIHPQLSNGYYCYFCTSKNIIQTRFNDTAFSFYDTIYYQFLNNQKIK